MQEYDQTAVAGFAMPLEVPTTAANPPQDGDLAVHDNTAAIEAARARHTAHRGPYNPAREARAQDATRDGRNAMLAERSRRETARATQAHAAMLAAGDRTFREGIEATLEADRKRREDEQARRDFLTGHGRS
ncbi:hypothetical protein G4X40_04240 [Rhodococcus sp. D2-41]|uniref:Uncharacterized protein n=1 Tax=Speluncibacter jeojiensis TaxID=2710754 RepID=A0A9X4RJE2_9ACTN|nr:hypothetical protein [Rhodococcus sp. D2-41]MDG3009354.1 hypothetical protein [Rhodococcus sp. D2-41]MDG3017091.1 hypothetical protein [Corynebacteriales bacterium D3-21]